MKRYLSVFSIKEVISALLSALLITTAMVLSLIMSEPIPWYLTSLLIFTIPIALSHRFYLVENKTRNLIGGRVSHDLLIALFVFCFFFIGLKSTDHFYLIGHSSNLIFLVILSISIGETLVSITSKILRQFGWVVW